MEVLDTLETKLDSEHLSRVASSLDAINKLKRQIEVEQAVVKKATTLNGQIKNLEDKIKMLESSKDYVSKENLKERTMAIETHKILLENICLIHKHIQLTQSNPAFLKDLKEEILVSMRILRSFSRGVGGK